MPPSAAYPDTAAIAETLVILSEAKNLTSEAAHRANLARPFASLSVTPRMTGGSVKMRPKPR